MDRKRKPGIYLLTDTGKEIDLIGVMPAEIGRACAYCRPSRSWSPS